ncbi:MAG: hypothetical protein JW745_05930 [Sedimentisphaerales bacterium]|nr:hypothetical protein [Sedimentisphaerales bacterium]MBN2841597.1 hypothetical protein [Sedimentisphaerales bacterium]
MTKIQIRIIIIIVILSSLASWFYLRVQRENSLLADRAIPEKSEILKAMQDLTAGNEVHSSYVESLKRLCQEMPVNYDVIMNRLEQVNLNDPEQILINVGQERAIGSFVIKSWVITGNNMSPAQLDQLLYIAQELSHTTPSINIGSKDKLNALITIYGLTFNE